MTIASIKTGVTEIKNKIPEIINLATKPSLNTKVTQIEKNISYELDTWLIRYMVD